MLHHGSTNFGPRVCPLDALSLVPEGIKRDLRTCNGKVFLPRSLAQEIKSLVYDLWEIKE